MFQKTAAIAFWIIVGVVLVVWAADKFIGFGGDLVDDATRSITIPSPPGAGG